MPQSVSAVPFPRYTEASLVKKLEELGIGRPSTYAPTISTILKRGYVEKRDKEGVLRNFRVLKLKENKISKLSEQETTGAEKSKLFPTDLGLVVTDFLKLYFDDIMDYNFTARIEAEFDEVASGKIEWNDMIENDFISHSRKMKRRPLKPKTYRVEKRVGRGSGFRQKTHRADGSLWTHGSDW